MTKQILPPVHTSFETAYEVEDYPYGFSLRTKIRFWIETKKNHGQHVVSCTMNPKVAGEHWNKPKAGTYHLCAVLYIDNDNGHIENTGMSEYNTENSAAFLAEYGDGLNDYYKGKLIIFAAMHQAQTETGLKFYNATPEDRKIIWSKVHEILIAGGNGDLIAKIK